LQIAQDGMTDGTVVALGELGLDYERIEFCPKSIQHRFCHAQLQHVALPTGLPLFLHNRACHADLLEVLQKERDDSGLTVRGVVHSFDDSLELAMRFIEELDLTIGINGCSLRTDDSLQVVRDLPLDRILLETDCPYCEIRNTHPSAAHVRTTFPAKAEKKFEAGLCVKNRQEPCHIIQVAEVIAGVKQMPLSEVAQACYANTLKLYGWQSEDINTQHR
jgi:TatD DNase family protein